MGDAERGPVDRPALSRLLGVPAERFADEHWGASPLLTRAAELPGGFADLFSADAVDELVARRAVRTPFVRMANEGTVLSPDRYTAPGGFGAEIADQLSSDRVLEEYANGSTLVLQALHRTWAPLSDFTRQLVADLGHPCQVNAYVTPAASRGFDPHYDVHDVFVIQVHGEKRWTIHPPVHPDPLGNEPWTDHRAAVAREATGEAAIEATFRPGDVLYLPRGWIHSATAQGGTSIHLTIGVAALTRFDIVEQVMARAAEQGELRRSLPMGIDVSSEDELRTIVAETVADLIAGLQDDDTAAARIADRLGRRLHDSTRAEPVRPLATIDALETMDGSSTVSWRHGLSARLVPEGATISVSLSSKTVTLPAESAEALTLLHSGKPAPAGALPGLDPDSSLVVARRLVREGILVVR